MNHHVHYKVNVELNLNINKSTCSTCCFLNKANSLCYTCHSTLWRSVCLGCRSCSLWWNSCCCVWVWSLNKQKMA